MPIARKVPPLPPADFPVIDSAGRMTDPWRAYFIALNALLAEIVAAIP
jgi:hypothetical protein